MSVLFRIANVVDYINNGADKTEHNKAADNMQKLILLEQASAENYGEKEQQIFYIMLRPYEPDIFFKLHFYAPCAWQSPE